MEKNRFKRARTEYNQHGPESVKTVSEATGITKSLIDDLESNILKKRETSYLKIATLAKHYGVSVDYLAGLSDVPNRDTDIQAVCEYTGLSPDTVTALHRSKVWGTELEHAKVIDFLMLDTVKRPANSNYRPILETMNSFLSYPHNAEATHHVRTNGEVVPIVGGATGFEIPLDSEMIENVFLTRIQQALVFLKREWGTHADMGE